MKIAVASAIGWPYVRRGSRFTYELASYLATKGHEVHYITSKPGTRSRKRQQDGFFTEYHRLASGPLLNLIKVENLDTFIVPCLLSLLKKDFDIVQTVLPMDAFAASMTRTLRGTPYVHYMIDSFQPFYYITRYGKYMLKRGALSAVQVTAPSRFIIDNIKKNFGIDALLTPPPVDTSQFSLCGSKDLKNPRILYTSSIHDPRKGFLLLVKAFEELLKHVPGAQLQLSGHTHPKAIEVIFKSVSPRTRKAIEILGVGRREDLPALYRNAAVTVLPSLNESFGMVLLESLASGTPIVGTKSGGIPDILSNTEIGVSFEPNGGPEELCGAILKGLELAKDEAVWNKCRKHAESFSWNALGPGFEKMYEDIIEKTIIKNGCAGTKNKKALKVTTHEPAVIPLSDITDLRRIFDDVLDEIEIDYDNYYRIDRYKPLCVHVAGWLMKNGQQSGNVLVVGYFTFPLFMFLKKCGFAVRGIDIKMRHEPWNNLGNQAIISDINELKDQTGCYDIIICDDIIQYFEFPVRTLEIFREKLNPVGVLILVAKNSVNENSRLGSFMRKKICSTLNSGTTEEKLPADNEAKIAEYGGYTVKEVKKLTFEAGFSVNQGIYMIKEKAVEGSMFPIQFQVYFYRKLHYLVQKVFPPFRSHVFVAASKNITHES